VDELPEKVSLKCEK